VGGRRRSAGDRLAVRGLSRPSAAVERLERRMSLRAPPEASGTAFADDLVARRPSRRAFTRLVRNS
jgi:hypothetical protein